MSQARVILLTVAVVTTVFVVNVVGHVPLSLIDEFIHIDYLVRASHLEQVRAEDRVSQEAMREAACRGSDTGTYPPCDLERHDPRKYTWRGISPAANHTPHYYWTTGVVARLLTLITWENSVVTWGRLLGAAWFALGTWLTFCIARRLGIPTIPVAIAIVAVAAAPAVLHSATRINPDATAFAGGALVLLAAVAWDQRQATLIHAFVASYVCASLDPTNALAIIAAMSYLVVRSLQSSDRRDRLSTVKAIGTMAVAAVVAFGTWRLALVGLGSGSSVGHPQELAHHVDRLPLSKLFGPEAVFAIFPPLSGYVWPNQMTTGVQTFLLAMIFTTCAALVGLTSRADTEGRTGVFGGATTAVLLVGGPLLVLQNYLLLQWYFPITSRYGLSLLCGVVIALAWLGRTRIGITLVGTAGGGLAISSMVRFL